jgi:hypothetical protein
MFNDWLIKTYAKTAGLITSKHYQQERANTFRRERVAQVLNGEAPVELASQMLGFVHSIPLGTQPFTIDMSNSETRDYLLNVAAFIWRRIYTTR